MGKFKGNRYRPQPSDGVEPIFRKHIDKIEYGDACKQYRDDKKVEIERDNEMRVNWITISNFISPLSGPVAYIKDHFTPEMSFKDPREDLTGLSREEIRESWNLLIEHFGPGVVVAPKEVLNSNLRGYYGDPAAYDVDGDGVPDKIVDVQIEHPDGSITLISADPDEPTIYVSPVKVISIEVENGQSSEQGNSIQEGISTSFKFEPMEINLSPTDEPAHSNPSGLKFEPMEINLSPTDEPAHSNSPVQLKQITGENDQGNQTENSNHSDSDTQTLTCQQPQPDEPSNLNSTDNDEGQFSPENSSNDCGSPDMQNTDSSDSNTN